MFLEIYPKVLLGAKTRYILKKFFYPLKKSPTVESVYSQKESVHSQPKSLIKITIFFGNLLHIGLKSRIKCTRRRFYRDTFESVIF